MFDNFSVVNYTYTKQGKERPLAVRVFKSKADADREALYYRKERSDLRVRVYDRSVHVEGTSFPVYCLVIRQKSIA